MKHKRFEKFTFEDTDSTISLSYNGEVFTIRMDDESLNLPKTSMGMLVEVYNRMIRYG